MHSDWKPLVQMCNHYYKQDRELESSEAVIGHNPSKVGARRRELLHFCIHEQNSYYFLFIQEEKTIKLSIQKVQKDMRDFHPKAALATSSW